MSKEAMNLALEALKSCDAAHITDGGRQWYDEKLVDKAVEAIEKALADQPAQGCDYCTHPQYAGTKCKNCGREQPAQQEPVKWSSYEPDGTHHNKPAQSKQKPVAWLKAIDTPGGWGKFVEAKPNEKGARPVYTSPPASKPLTDEEIERCMKQAYATVQGRNLERAFARAIEAAHGIKGDA